MIQRWPHQLRGVRSVFEAIDAGERRILLTSPTGGGKTLMVSDIVQEFLLKRKRVVLYSNRKMMVEQLSGAMEAAGLRHGIRAAGYDDEGHHLLQISSIQTEISRTKKGVGWKLYEADLAVVDEAHLQTGKEARRILDAHYEAGAVLLGITATPIDLGDAYTHLVVAGTTSELRRCGALVLAKVYGCDEPDMRQFKKLRETADTISENDARKAMMTPGLFGRVLEWFEKLNPEHKPTILFAPGVQESIWFAEQFYAAGIVAGHIDGQDVWANGRFYKNSPEVRANVLGASKSGKCVVLCNRFVLREGVDAPWIGHCILATCIGSVSSFIQTVGRGLRAYPGLEEVVIQDHGGNWWRHGSPNADREWVIGATAGSVSGLRQDRLRDTAADKKPSRCPKCGMIQIWKGPICQGCAFEVAPGRKVSRPVVQTDGTLREMTGDIFRPHRPYRAPNGPALWERMYYRSKSDKAKGRSFKAAMALFAMENNWGWPDRSWPLMPTKELDFYRAVRDVPFYDLIQRGERDGHQNEEAQASA